MAAPALPPPPVTHRLAMKYSAKGPGPAAAAIPIPPQPQAPIKTLGSSNRIFLIFYSIFFDGTNFSICHCYWVISGRKRKAYGKAKKLPRLPELFSHSVNCVHVAARLSEQLLAQDQGQHPPSHLLSPLISAHVCVWRANNLLILLQFSEHQECGVARRKAQTKKQRGQRQNNVRAWTFLACISFFFIYIFTGIYAPTLTATSLAFDGHQRAGHLLHINTYLTAGKTAKHENCWY